MSAPVKGMKLVNEVAEALQVACEGLPNGLAPKEPPTYDAMAEAVLAVPELAAAFEAQAKLEAERTRVVAYRLDLSDEEFDALAPEPGTFARTTWAELRAGRPLARAVAERDVLAARLAEVMGLLREGEDFHWDDGPDEVHSSYAARVRRFLEGGESS